MPDPMPREDIYAKVTEVLVDALGVDEDEVTPASRLAADLGAESIDYLDIVFKLEQAFDIKIPQGELFPENVASNPEYVQDGKVTEHGISELRKRLPHINFDAFAADPKLVDVPNLFTVDVLVNYVDRKINESVGA
jgi:acyl carrier protein